MVSTTTAKSNDLKVGSYLHRLGAVFTVKAISAVTLTAERHGHRPTRDRTAPSPPRTHVLSAVTTTDSLTHSEWSRHRRDHLRAGLPRGRHERHPPKPTRRLARSTASKSLPSYSLIGAMGAGADHHFLIMVMIVRERKPEVGSFKAIGGPNRRIMGQFIDRGP